MSSKFGKVFFAILLVCLFVTVSAYAQVGTTSIRGVVTDKTGAAVVGARVTLSSPAQAFRREVQTNQAGEYEFLALPPSAYVLTVEMANFRKFENKNVQLLVNLPGRSMLRLRWGLPPRLSKSRPKQ